jgi:hypothetical protein
LFKNKVLFGCRKFNLRGRNFKSNQTSSDGCADLTQFKNNFSTRLQACIKILQHHELVCQRMRLFLIDFFLVATAFQLGLGGLNSDSWNVAIEVTDYAYE